MIKIEEFCLVPFWHLISKNYANVAISIGLKFYKWSYISQTAWCLEIHCLLFLLRIKGIRKTKKNHA